MGFMAINIPWGSEHAIAFVTNVGLITSKGQHGDNVMASEWTHHVSYEPGLIAVSLGKLNMGGNPKATFENIKATGVFGVSLAASEQNALANIAGNNTGREIDKIAALKELGFSFVKAREIDVLLVEGALAQFECRVINTVDAGDHVLVIGEVLYKHPLAKDKQPLVYHGLKFWKLGEALQKPAADVIQKIDATVEKHRKK